MVGFLHTLCGDSAMTIRGQAVGSKPVSTRSKPIVPETHRRHTQALVQAAVAPAPAAAPAPAPAPAVAPAPLELDLMRDGIQGREIPYTRVPNGNDAFQYAVGTTEIGRPDTVYRRRASERGTYGGWRWETDISHLRPETAPAPAPAPAPPACSAVRCCAVGTGMPGLDRDWGGSAQ